MSSELQYLSDNAACDLIYAPQDEPIIQNKWVFKRQVGRIGNECYRVRLVPNGFTQQKGIDFEEGGKV